MDTTGVLTVSGLILYCVNYITGWLLKLKIITVTAFTHRLIYILLIADLVLLLCLLDFASNKFLLYSFSLLSLLAVPLNINADKYHILVSTLALLVYLFTMLNYQFFRLIA